MSSDPVVAALRAALKVSDGAELRAALGARLLELGDAANALVEAEAALTLEPAHARALGLAEAAAEQSGQAAKAGAYRIAREAQEHGRESSAAGPERPVQPSGVEPAPVAHLPFAGSTVGSGARPGLRLVTDADIARREEEAHVTFADVGGLEELKQRLKRSFLLPLQQPALFAKFGKSMRGGLLLYGPPGCGKTFIARALAGELGARFLSVSLSDVLDMWLGESERKLHEIFENARRHAPALVFFDEIDALGQRRTNLTHSAGRNIVNQLLAELDGIESRNRDLFILGATNHPWDLDPALRRPGRFDRMVFVPAPDAAGRATILALKLRDRPSIEGIDIPGLARRTEGFSGADLQALVDAATDLAFEQSVDRGVERSIDDALLAAAMRDMKPSTRPWLETARNYAIYANDGGSYDDLLGYLKTQRLA